MARRGHLLYLGAGPGACQLLNADGLCRAQVADGMGGKPGSCITFPFFPVFRVGRVVVARPEFRCPIGWASEEEGGTTVKLSELHEIYEGMDVGGWPLRELRVDGDGESWLAAELDFRQMLEAAVDDREWVAGLLAEQPDATTGQRAALSALFGPAPPDPPPSRALTVLALSLRTRMGQLPEAQRRRVLVLLHELWLRVGASFRTAGPGDVEGYLLRFLAPFSYLAWLPGEAGLDLSAPQQVPAGATPHLKLAAGVAQEQLRRGRSGCEAFAAAAKGLPDRAHRVALLHFLGGLTAAGQSLDTAEEIP